MKIKTSTVLKSLNGKNIQDEEKKDFTLGQALSNILLSDKTAGKMKLFLLAKKCFEDKDLEVDAADLNLIKNSVKTTEIYNALIAGQCEELLEEIKEK